MTESDSESSTAIPSENVCKTKEAEGSLGNGALLKFLVESSDDAIICKSLEGTIVSWNAGAQRVYGYAAEEVIGKPISILVPPEIRDEIPEILEKIKRGEHVDRYQTVRMRKDHGRINVSICVSPVKDEDGNIIGASTIARDITERKKAEEDLLTERDRLEIVTESIGAGLAVISKDYRTLWANRVLKRIFGDVEGKLCYSTYNQRSEICPRCGVQEVLEGGKDIVVHEQVGKDVDGKIIWSEITATPVNDKSGKVTAAVELVVPVTERKRAEEKIRETMQKLEVTNEKLRVVGGLTRHDVRNKLAAITGNAYLVRKKLPENSVVLDYVKQIEGSVEQTVRILDFAKAYEMLGAEELVYIEVEKTVNEAIFLFPDLRDIKVSNECHGLTVIADSLLRQLFYNLIDNSLKHGKKVSQIRIHYEIEGDRLRLFYEDDGLGIPPEAKKRIFQQGYTTGTGTGYGLYLIKKITEVYGWTIEENGKARKGARFVMTISKTSPNARENYGILTQ